MLDYSAARAHQPEDINMSNTIRFPFGWLLRWEKLPAGGIDEAMLKRFNIEKLPAQVREGLLKKDPGLIRGTPVHAMTAEEVAALYEVIASLPVSIAKWRSRCVGGPGSPLGTAVKRGGITTAMPSLCTAIVW
jgi:hypothetical protein